MTTRSALLLLLLLTPAASAQFVVGGQIVYSWSWSEVVAGTATPSLLSPGVIEPGEGVRLTLTAEFSPPVGSVVPITGSPLSNEAVIAGFGIGNFGLTGQGDRVGEFAAGVTPASLVFVEYFPPPNFQFAIVTQYLLGTGPVDARNPIELLAITWTPSVYTPREISFLTIGLPGAAEPDALMVTVPGPSGPSLIAARVAGSHTGTGAIPIVPAPGAPMIMLGAGVLAVRRRRRNFEDRRA